MQLVEDQQYLVRSILSSGGIGASAEESSLTRLLTFKITGFC